MLFGYRFVLPSDEFDSLDEIVKPEMKQAYESDKKIGSQQTNLATEHPAYLSLNL